MVPPKAASKAEAGSTSTGRPVKAPATKATAPKLTARRTATNAAAPKLTARGTATKAATATSAPAAKQTPKQVPSKKEQRKEATTKISEGPITKETLAFLDRPTLPGEEAPTQEDLRRIAAALEKGTTTHELTDATPAKPKQQGKTPQQRANTSRKRRSSSIEDEVEPVATRTATKKTKTGPSSSKRKADADANKRPQKVAKTGKETAVNKAASSAKKPASSKAKKTPSKATPTADRTGRKPAASKVQKTPKVRKAPAAKLQTGVQINFAPTQPLDIFIFGSGESGELGLGNQKVDGKKPVNVKRPRIHPFLSAEAVGVVQIACGGMHTVALTKDNRILTWGVNDQGALGRDTTWDGGLRDADAEEDDDGDDFEALNPVECTPAEVSTRNIGNGTKFVKVIASDSASFALTEDGRLYGWGTFRVSTLYLALLPTN